MWPELKARCLGGCDSISYGSTATLIPPNVKDVVGDGAAEVVWYDTFRISRPRGFWLVHVPVLSTGTHILLRRDAS